MSMCSIWVLANTSGDHFNITLTLFLYCITLVLKLVCIRISCKAGWKSTLGFSRPGVGSENLYFQVPSRCWCFWPITVILFFTHFLPSHSLASLASPLSILYWTLLFLLNSQWWHDLSRAWPYTSLLCTLTSFVFLSISMALYIIYTYI